MFQSRQKGRFGRTLLIAGAALGTGLMASAAFAGECPADQKKPDAREAAAPPNLNCERRNAGAALLPGLPGRNLCPSLAAVLKPGNAPGFFVSPGHDTRAVLK
jgi:hypothetical protein